MSFTPQQASQGPISESARIVKRWFTFVAAFLFFWLCLYAFVHMEKVNTGYEYQKFTTAQIQQVTRILYNGNTTNTESNEPAASPVDDTIWRDSLTAATEQARPVHRMVVCDDSCRITKALIYISNEFDGKIKDEQLDVIRQYISSFNSQEVGLFLATMKVKVKSYFWLTGPMVYMEIVFWVIIGVACSILFAIGNANRQPGRPIITFDESEIPYQVAKLFYAPFCTIILVLTYNYIKHRNVVEVNTNEGMIVFSFISGLFSGRLMSLFERFKDVLLPEHTLTAPLTNTDVIHSGYISPLSVLSSPRQAPPAPQPEAQAQPEPMPAPVAAPAPAPAPPPPPAPVPQPVVTYQEPVMHEPLLQEEEYIAPQETKEPDDIKEISIELKLDVGGLFEEERDEIMEHGYDTAVVTLHNVNGKDIISAIYEGGNGKGIFFANDVKPGIYILRSTLTQKLIDNYVINLFGEKTVYLTHENNQIELYIKKYEAMD